MGFTVKDTFDKMFASQQELWSHTFVQDVSWQWTNNEVLTSENFKLEHWHDQQYQPIKTDGGKWSSMQCTYIRQHQQSWASHTQPTRKTTDTVQNGILRNRLAYLWLQWTQWSWVIYNWCV